MAGTGLIGRDGFAEVRIDYGCGLGDFLVESARREPGVLFYGVDCEDFCLGIARGRIEEAGLENVRTLLVEEGCRLDGLFAPGSVSMVYLNFPTPHPRARDARRRMTHLDNLLAYRRILAPGGAVRIKTDSQPLRDYTLVQLKAAGYRLEWSVDDVREALPDDPVTGYERKAAERGATSFGIQAVPDAEPDEAASPASSSLYDYLPDDLESLRYIPADMERSVRNAIEARRAIEERRLLRANTQRPSNRPLEIPQDLRDL